MRTRTSGRRAGRWEPAVAQTIARTWAARTVRQVKATAARPARAKTRKQGNLSPERWVTIQEPGAFLMFMMSLPLFLHSLGSLHPCRDSRPPFAGIALAAGLGGSGADRQPEQHRSLQQQLNDSGVELGRLRAARGGGKRSCAAERTAQATGTPVCTTAQAARATVERKT